MNDLGKLYTEDEMIEEVCAIIEGMGGTVDVVDKENNFFKITIDPYLEEEASMVLEEILNKYSIKRKEVLRNNPFLRASELREELYGSE